MYSRLFEDEITLAFKDERWQAHFVDIGAGDGRSWSNSLLLAESGWSGACFEINPQKLESLRKVHAGRPQVKCMDFKVNRENVLPALAELGTPKRLCALSIDIDGVDAYVLEAVISAYEPQIVVVEFNHLVPPPVRFCVDYKADWTWGKGGFFGASIDHLNDICSAVGYGLQHVIGGNGIWMYGRVPAGSPEQLWRSEHIPLIRITNGADGMDLQSGLRVDLDCDAKIRHVNEQFKIFEGQYRVDLAAIYENP